jgi:hypothetical protein
MVPNEYPHLFRLLVYSIVHRPQIKYIKRGFNKNKIHMIGYGIIILKKELKKFGNKFHKRNF